MDERHRMVAAVAALALVGLIAVLRGMRRQARLAARAAEDGMARVSVFGRGLLLAALIVGSQWLTITYAAHNLTLYWTVLGIPATVTGLTVARVFTVATGPRVRRGGGHR